MSWHFSRALVAGFSEATYLDGAPSAPSNTTPTPEAFYWPDKTTEHSRLSRFGMTSEPLMGVRGEDLLMWFREVSLARTSASQELATGWTESEAGSGQKWLGSFARYNHDASSWKTAQFSLLADSDEFLETWPRWGSMLNGESYLRPIPALPICVSASGLWPTPTCDSGTERSKRYAQGGTPLTLAVKSWPTPCARDYRGIGRSRLERTGSTAGENPPHIVGGLLNPTWVEWLMGWPIGWTELKPLETDKFREWQQQHSICSHEVKNAA